MRVRDAAGGLLVELEPMASVAGGRALPCFRCGICCERWQPLLTPADVARLRETLELTAAAFEAAYTAPYPFSDEERLLRRGDDGACIFLRWEHDGRVRRAACAAHAARPAVCREWAAGLDKKECVHGLTRFASPDGDVSLPVLYPDAVEREAAAAALSSRHGALPVSGADQPPRGRWTARR